MKIKFISCLLCFVLIFSTAAIAGTDYNNVFVTCAEASEASGVFGLGDFEYTVFNDNELIITKYLGNSRKVSIPSEINGIPVTVIGEYSFNGQVMPSKDDGTIVEHPNAKYNNRITEISIPSSVYKIERNAFENLEKLKKVKFSEGLKSVDAYAFANCGRLETADLPNSLENVSFNAFDNTNVEELFLGKNVTNLYFEEGKNSSIKKIICNAEKLNIKLLLNNENCMLEEIVCNGDLESVTFLNESGALKRIICKGKTNYQTVLSLLSKEFHYNYDVVNYQIVFSRERFVAEKEKTDKGFRYYINEDNEAVITRYIGEKSIVNVPARLGGCKVTEIAPFAFSSLLAEGMEFIKGNDYHISMNLITYISLPKSINIINEYAFAYNTSLESINIPSGITEIPERCFYYCSSLKSIDLPKNLLYIGEESFTHCKSIKNISIPDRVKEIGDAAFERCSSLETAEIEGVEKIGERAFNYCTSLDDVNYSSKLIEIGASAFSFTDLGGTVDISNVTKLGAGAFSFIENIEKVILSNNLEKLENGTFQQCSALTEINFPEKLVSIGNYCFRFAGLKEAIFGSNLKEIGALAFENCKNLYVVDLPEGLEKIGSFAFENTKIDVITIPESLKVIGYKSFANCKSLETVYFNSVNCKIGDYFFLDEEIDYENLSKASPFYGCNIKNIFIGEKVSTIGNDTSEFGAFENCSEIKSVIIPDTVVEIGNAAFKSCSNLETAVIPASVTEIADNAFDGCDKLNIFCVENSFVHSYALEQGIKVSTFIISAIPNQIYTGYEIKPEVNVFYSGNALNRNTDFSVSYSNNINVGNAVVYIKGKNDFKNFSSKANFTITTKNIIAATIAPISEQSYTGSAVYPLITVTDGNRVLNEGKDYVASYTNNIQVGTATVKITGKGNYSGSTSAEFQIKKLSTQQSFFNRLTSFFRDIFLKIRSFFGVIVN